MLNILRQIASEQDGTHLTDVLLSVDIGGGNQWVKRGQIIVSNDEETVALFQTVVANQSRGQSGLACATRWPDHEVRATGAVHVGHSDIPIHIRLSSVVTVEYAETDHQR